MIREVSIISLLGFFEKEEYAAIGLEMAQNNPDDTVQLYACDNLGFVLPKISDIELRKKIAEYFLNNIFNKEEDNQIRTSSYSSIYISLDYLPKYWHCSKGSLNNIDMSVIAQFKKKYLSPHLDIKKIKKQRNDRNFLNKLE